jgi:hypothetical protein
VVCIESIPAYAGVVVPRLPILVYVWLSCRAVVLANLVAFFRANGRVPVDHVAVVHLMILAQPGEGPFGV